MTRGPTPRPSTIFSICLVVVLLLASCGGPKKIVTNPSMPPPAPPRESVSPARPVPEKAAELPPPAEEKREKLPAPPKPKTVLVAAVGDIMMGTENLLPEDGGVGLFTEPKPYLHMAGITFGNLEGPLTDRGSPTKVSQSGVSYCFRTPPHYARFLKEAGFNMVSIANNHINDYGPEGKEQTIATLEEYDIGWSGPPGTVARKTVNGLDVVMVAFHTSSHSHWVNDISEAGRIVSDLAGQNDVVIVSFHGGAEGAEATHVPIGNEIYHGEDRGDLRRFSHEVVDAGADLVIGHGPHVPRGIELYKNRLIAYSLGNFCTTKGINVRDNNGLAPLLLVRLDHHGALMEGKIISFKQQFGQHPRLDLTGQAADFMARLSREDFPDTCALHPDGTIIAAQPNLQAGQNIPPPVH